MKPLTLKHILKNSKPHPLSQVKGNENARQYKEQMGDYLLSIVGGGVGLYGDFKNTFEVALIDTTNDEFVTDMYSKSEGGVLGYASLDEINELYFMIPRK